MALAIIYQQNTMGNEGKKETMGGTIFSSIRVRSGFSSNSLQFFLHLLVLEIYCFQCFVGVCVAAFSELSNGILCRSTLLV